LPAKEYLQIVAATNFKQRIRETLEYFHADRLNYAVLGTPNRLEYDQGFFVKNGDGSADIKPIAHLYKTQVYALACHLGLPGEVCSARPTTDTYSMPQGQDEFYFVLPYEQMDLAPWALNHGVSPGELAPALGITEPQAEHVYADSLEAPSHRALAPAAPAYLCGRRNRSRSCVALKRIGALTPGRFGSSALAATVRMLEANDVLPAKGETALISRVERRAEGVIAPGRVDQRFGHRHVDFVATPQLAKSKRNVPPGGGDKSRAFKYPLHCGVRTYEYDFAAVASVTPHLRNATNNTRRQSSGLRAIRVCHDYFCITFLEHYVTNERARAGYAEDPVSQKRQVGPITPAEVAEVRRKSEPEGRFEGQEFG
jgi:hypothetical protein